MPLLYWKGSNFGDLLNETLLRPLLEPAILEEKEVLGIGTILDSNFVGAREQVVVMGSGIGRGAIPKSKILPLLVRGPHTALALHAPHLPQGDPGLLLESSGSQPRAGGVLIPHFRTFTRVPAAKLARVTGLRVLDVRWKPAKMLARLEGASHAYVEALHGAIACEALRIPWAPVQLAANEPPIKWMDALGPLKRAFILPPVYRPPWARRSIELLTRKHLLARFPDGVSGGGTELGSDGQLTSIRKTIWRALDRFNSGDH
ncbi:MAG TPA: hypothetical protein VHI93_03705 [Candidatus Thermoplasmatota archaeon]|nr:hypothetical protein [Candidatus Thermoplasmatota archaeon]